MEKSFLEELVTQTDTIISFIMLASDNITLTREYDTGHLLTTIEMHTLSKIADNPGICASHIARSWNRTPGAVNQNVNSLYRKGYIEKKKLPGNRKNIHLYPTREGQLLADRHKKIYRECWQNMLEQVLEHHTIVETRTFLQVMNSFVTVMQNKENAKQDP